MKRTIVLVVTASLAIFGGALVGCGDDDVAATPVPGADSGGGGDDGGTKPDGVAPDTGPPDAGGLLFTDYVKDLVQNHTADNTAPDDVMSKTFLPDPEDPNAFASGFF